MNETTVGSTPGTPDAARAPPTGWEAFEKALASTLSVLKDEFLILSTRPGNRYVQFHASLEDGVFAECVSDAYLDETGKLDAGQLATLLSLGWSPPTHAPDGTRPDGLDRGSPNHFHHLPPPCSFPEIARLVVRTLTEVLRIASPAELSYKAFDEDGHSLTLPILPVEPRPEATPGKKPLPRTRGPSPFARLRSRVLAAARNGSGLGSLEYEDGCLQVPIGDRTGWIRPFENPFFVRVHVHLLSEVEEDENFLARIHEMNARFPLARVIYAGRSVYLGIDFPAVPFRAEHLAQAITTVARLGDEVVAELRSPEAQPPAVN